MEVAVNAVPNLEYKLNADYVVKAVIMKPVY